MRNNRSLLEWQPWMLEISLKVVQGEQEVREARTDMHLISESEMTIPCPGLQLKVREACLAELHLHYNLKDIQISDVDHLDPALGLETLPDKMGIKNHNMLTDMLLDRHPQLVPTLDHLEEV